MEKYRVYAGIDLDAVRYNMESMHKNINKDTKMIAVVKTNGYGHGAMRISREVEDLPYLWGYAVATVDEAEELIADGRTKPILILGITFPDKFEAIVDEDIRPAISEFAAAKALSEVAVSKEKICSIHIAVDTGMSRIGFQVTEESADIIAQIAKLPNIMIEGIFTHFARADELSKEPAFEQFDLFKRMIALVEARGVEIAIKHCSNSAGIVEIPECNKDMVRASSINTDITTVTALAISNALVALSGAVIAQTQGFADVNSGSGMIVIGLASVIIGEVIFGKRSLSVGLVSAVVGSVIYRMIVAFALETNVFSANALKLLSAVIVAVTLSVPAVKNAISDRKMKREGMKNA